MADDLTSEFTTGEPVSPTELAGTPMSRGRIQLENQINALMASLDKRMNPPFDPMWMKIAAGFLKPSHTGSFGESLGNALEGAAEQSEKDIARRSDIEKLKLELAKNKYTLARQEEADKLFNQALSGQLGPDAMSMAQNTPKPTLAGAEGTSAAPTRLPVKGGEQPQEKVEETETIQANPQTVDADSAVKLVKTNPYNLQKITFTPDIVGAIMRYDKDLGEQANKIFTAQKEMRKLGIDEAKLAQGDIISTPRGIYSISQQKYIDKVPQTISVKNPFDPDKDAKFDMNTEDVEGWRRVVATRDTKKMDDFLVDHGYLPPASSTDSTGHPVRSTTAERDVRKATDIEAGKAEVEADKDYRKQYNNARNNSHFLTNNADQIMRVVSNPEYSKAFGVLNNATVQDAVLGAVQEGIRVGSWSVGVAGVENAVRKAGGNQREIDAALMLMRPLAETELIYTQMYLNKQGAITEGERAIVRNIGPSVSDTPRVIMAKAELIKARGKFDMTKADLLAQYDEKMKSQGKRPTVSGFENTPEYRELFREYDLLSDKISEKYFPVKAKK